ncbi:ABC transporter permease [Iamia sp. SCSIO 61187]|uniref:ABC transporter permease n=1 Tax=Iamia sp. SCSIO 61187 TaxID=2722752 RepID=UPI001C6296EC|nr:ABC transporter permease [Iamia sp. SCSIO 61187]QYG93565.1 ABC transporter permease [Iamia sp. SCSIO 61187]
MTVVDPTTTAAPVLDAEADAPRRRRDPLTRMPAWARFALYATVLVVILAAAEQITDANRLTSANTWSSALQLTIPIALAGLGGLWAERAGIVNIGLEGMMILGTFFGAWGCIEHGPWWGVVLGILGGAVGGLVHAVATVGFGVDHIVSGVAINILGAGVAQFLNLEFFDSTNQSPRLPGVVGDIRVPGLHDLIGARLTGPSLLVWLAVIVVLAVVVSFVLRRGGPVGDDGPLTTFARPIALVVLGVLGVLCVIDVAPYLDEQERFGVSELGRIVQGLTGEVSWIVVMGVVAFPVSAVILWRTKFGLRLRSVGEDPVAAESLGVNVYLMKVVATVISGALAGLGGVSLVYLFANQFRAGQTNGRGYIGLAAMIFGNWRPGGLALGAGLFGFTDTLSLQSGETTRSLLLVVALGSVFMVLRALITGRWKGAVVAILAGLAAYGWFEAIDELPNEIVVFLPHLTTLLVLTFASQRLRPPAADGLPYRRGRSG